ncbi:MAG: hypothetical protein KKD44_17395 [Proteobacteria bacterium]|nr:hypothetical protein [Pseudomonadota bacterium]
MKILSGTKRFVKSNTTSILSMMLIALAFMASNAFAIQPPTADSFAYTLYDLAVIQGLQGALGFVGGLFAVLYGVYLGAQNKYLPAVGTAICGGVLIGADRLVTSMGMVF